jgi:hypothetical protein
MSTEYMRLLAFNWPKKRSWQKARHYQTIIFFKMTVTSKFTVPCDTLEFRHDFDSLMSVQSAFFGGPLPSPCSDCVGGGGGGRGAGRLFCTGAGRNRTQGRRNVGHYFIRSPRPYKEPQWPDLGLVPCAPFYLLPVVLYRARQICFWRAYRWPTDCRIFTAHTLDGCHVYRESTRSIKKKLWGVM